MLDFTIKQYEVFLTALQEQNYTFQPFSEYIIQPAKRVIMLRHDVDNRKQNSLLFAKLLHTRGIKGSFYFRIVPASMDKDVIKQIAGMGHEIGYHYEDITFAHKLSSSRTTKNDVYALAWKLFRKHLSQLREICPINTISMHGSPRSRYDNKALWQKYDFRELGIIGEPYLDVNFNEVAYFTDTGRRWNGHDVSIRDKVADGFNFNFRTTQQIIENINRLPDKIMFTFHPQRWTDRPLPWLRELIMQNIKNVVKGVLVKRNWNEEA